MMEVSIGDEIQYSTAHGAIDRIGIVGSVDFTGKYFASVHELHPETKIPTGLIHKISIKCVDRIIPNEPTIDYNKAFDRAMKGI